MRQELLTGSLHHDFKQLLKYGEAERCLRKTESSIGHAVRVAENVLFLFPVKNWLMRQLTLLSLALNLSSLSSAQSSLDETPTNSCYHNFVFGYSEPDSLAAYATSTQETAQACQKQCQADDQCAGFLWKISTHQCADSQNPPHARTSTHQ